MKTKYYKIYGSIKFIFDGNSEIIMKVSKETKDKIYGFKTNMFGNQTPYTMKLFGDKIIISEENITIIKRNVQGWVQIK